MREIATDSAIVVIEIAEEGIESAREIGEIGPERKGIVVKEIERREEIESIKETEPEFKNPTGMNQNEREVEVEVPAEQVQTLLKIEIAEESRNNPRESAEDKVVRVQVEYHPRVLPPLDRSKYIISAKQI